MSISANTKPRFKVGDKVVILVGETLEDKTASVETNITGLLFYIDSNGGYEFTGYKTPIHDSAYSYSREENVFANIQEAADYIVAKGLKRYE